MPRSGLAWSAEVDWEQARVWASIPPAEWDMMSGERKSFHIAVYMIHRQGEAVVAKDQADEMKRKNRKGKKGGKGSSR